MIFLASNITNLNLGVLPALILLGALCLLACCFGPHPRRLTPEEEQRNWEADQRWYGRRR